MSNTYLNRVMMPTATVGTGTLTVSSAITNATLGDFFTLLESGSMDGETVPYVLWEGHNVEMGTGTIGATGTTLTRTVTASKIGGVAGTSKISLLGGGTVMLAPLAADLSGGGGPAIEPESGSSPIKISAFPAAATPMGSTDTVTGLQGGANANFTQAQILAGRNAAAASNLPGADITVRSGSGDGIGTGGQILAYGGSGANGGHIRLYAGHGYVGTGGSIDIDAGQPAGNVNVTAGTNPVGRGGNANLLSGASGYTQGSGITCYGPYSARGGDLTAFAGPAISGSAGVGGTIKFSAGAGDGTSVGGPCNFYSGAGGKTSGAGGHLKFKCGNSYGSTAGSDITFIGGGGAGTGNGGPIHLYGGYANAGIGGPINIQAGNVYAGGGTGGGINVSGGYGNGAGNGGAITLTMGAGGGGGGLPGTLILVNAVSTPGAHTGTLTNAPAVGNPQTWLAVTINGVAHFIPAWHV